MIITIDGPAGAGKSSVARGLAEALGGRYLDTGALYRAVTLLAVRQGVDFRDVAALGALAREAELTIEDGEDGVRVLLNGEDVSDAIRDPEVGRQIKGVADAVLVRDELNKIQRRIAEESNILITEGRDQGSEVFPHADVKFFLDAPLELRARRRQLQLEGKGIEVDYSKLMEDQEIRDRQDRERRVGALKKTNDMIVIESGEMSLEEVIQAMLEHVKE
jgi:cytidylate kinase